MDFMEFRAKTKDDAITQACLRFGVTSDLLEYEIIDEGKAGFFGIGSRDAVIKARVKAEEKAQPELKEPVKSKPQSKKNSDKNTAGKEKNSSSKNDRKKNDKKPDVKKEKKAAAPEEKKTVEPAEELKENKSADVTTDDAGNKARSGGIVTSDEIEKRAAAAAAKAKSEGIDISPDKENYERSHKRDRRDRRDGRNRTRDRRNRKELSSETNRKENVRSASTPRPERVVVPKTEEEIAEIKEQASAFLEDVFRCMGVNVNMTMEYDQKEGCLGCTFSGDEMGILIGKRGQTLDSLQYLTSLVINKKKNDYTRVKLDTEDYRARRADTLQNLSRNIAYKVKRTRRPVELEPMNPYERRIIHSSLQGNKYVETYSEGEEPYRHVVVAPKRQ